METCIAITTKNRRCTKKPSVGGYCGLHSNRRNSPNSRCVKIAPRETCISQIYFWNDSRVLLHAICDECHHENGHNITGNLDIDKINNTITVNLLKLGTRGCDTSYCCNDYLLKPYPNWSEIIFYRNTGNFDAIIDEDNNSITIPIDKFVTKKKDHYIINLPNPYSKNNNNVTNQMWMLRVDRFSFSYEERFRPVGYINIKFKSKNGAFDHYDNNGKGMRGINVFKTGESDWNAESCLRCVVCKEEDIDTNMRIYTIDEVNL